MSRRPVKPPATVEMSGMTDEKLRAELKVFGVNPVINESTRPLMVKKLEKLKKESKSACPVPAAVNGSNKQSGETSVMRVVVANKGRSAVTNFSSDEEMDPTANRTKVAAKKRVSSVISTPKKSPTVIPESPVKPSQRTSASTYTTGPSVTLFSSSTNSARGFDFSDNEGQMEIDEGTGEAEEEESDVEQEIYEVMNRSMNTSIAPSVNNSVIKPAPPSTRWNSDVTPIVSAYRPPASNLLPTTVTTSRFGLSTTPATLPDPPAVRPIGSAINSSIIGNRYSSVTSDYDRHSFSRPYTSPKPMFSLPESQEPYRNRDSFTSINSRATSFSTPAYQRPSVPSVAVRRQPGWGEKASNTLQSLNKYRRNAYKIVADRLYQLWAGHEESDDDEDDDRYDRRFSAPTQEKRSARTSSFKWPKLTEGVVMYSFWGFMALISVMYVLTVHSDKLHIVHGVAIDSAIFIYDYLIMPLLGVLLFVGIIFGAYWYQRYRWHKQADEQRQVYEMVESIINTVRDHHADRVAFGEKDPFLAIVHARDHLIAPSQRRTLGPIWDKAVEYLQQNESRLRQESQCISGEDFMVWRWLQTTSPIRGKGWQGLAFPEEQMPLNMPRFPYTTCLKARGLFDPSKETDPNWPEEVRKAIRSKIGPGVKVLDIRLDTQSNEGCAFIKCGSKEDAGQAYKVLHGNWFNGQLVSVKYIKPERFNIRFPDSKDY